MAKSTYRRQSARWDRTPHQMGKRRTRAVLVEDALNGVETPVGWALAAYAYLGDGTGAGADREYLSVRQEVASKGGVMPGAPGS